MYKGMEKKSDQRPNSHDRSEYTCEEENNSNNNNICHAKQMILVLQLRVRAKTSKECFFGYKKAVVRKKNGNYIRARADRQVDDDDDICRPSRGGTSNQYPPVTLFVN